MVVSVYAQMPYKVAADYILLYSGTPCLVSCRHCCDYDLCYRHIIPPSVPKNQNEVAEPAHFFHMLYVILASSPLISELDHSSSSRTVLGLLCW